MSNAPVNPDLATAERSSERAARRLAMAEELAQMGMNVARVLEQRVLTEARHRVRHVRR